MVHEGVCQIKENKTLLLFSFFVFYSMQSQREKFEEITSGQKIAMSRELFISKFQITPLPNPCQQHRPHGFSFSFVLV